MLEEQGIDHNPQRRKARHKKGDELSWMAHDRAADQASMIKRGMLAAGTARQFSSPLVCYRRLPVRQAQLKA